MDIRLFEVHLTEYEATLHILCEAEFASVIYCPQLCGQRANSFKRGPES